MTLDCQPPIIFLGTYPISPNTSAAFLWVGGQFLGIIFSVVMDQLRYPDGKGNPPRNMKLGLIFQGVVACVFAFLVLLYNAPDLRREAELKKNHER